MFHNCKAVKSLLIIKKWGWRHHCILNMGTFSFKRLHSVIVDVSVHGLLGKRKCPCKTWAGCKCKVAAGPYSLSALFTGLFDNDIVVCWTLHEEHVQHSLLSAGRNWVTINGAIVEVMGRFSSSQGSSNKLEGKEKIRVEFFRTLFLGSKDSAMATFSSHPHLQGRR